MATSTPAPASEDVVVTAQRRSEKLKDVPASVEAFSAAQLQAAGVTSTQDLAVLTPGFVAGQQAGYAQPFLRGVGTVASSAGLENPVALYVDDVYYSSVPGSILSLNNIQDLEIEKGPQGTLFGRNATGGLIKVTTKDPSDRLGGSVSGTFGNYQTAGTDVYLTGPIANDLTSNLAVYFQDQGKGYGVNLYNGDQVSRTQDLSVRNKWELITADGTIAKLILDYEQTSYIPNYGPAPGTLALGAPSYRVPPQDIAGIFQPFGFTRQGGVSLNVEHSFGLVKLTSISAYRQTFLDVDPSAQLTVDPVYSIGGEVFEQHMQGSQEFILSSATPRWLNWTAGTYLYAADGAYLPTSFTEGGLLFPITSIGLHDNQNTYSAAVYGQATARILPTTNLTIGLRYTVERHDYNGFEILEFPGNQSFTFRDSVHAVTEKPTWRFALDHHFTADIMAYVSYDRGFKSGGFNDAMFPTVPYAPETLDDYEVGTKLELFHHRVTLDASGFLYEYKNIQEIQYLANSPSGYIYSGARARLYGLDIDSRFKVSRNFSLTASAELINSRFLSFPAAPISTPIPGGGTAYATGSVAGRQLPFTPKSTVSIGGNYIVPLGRLGKAIANVTYAYNDGFFGEPDNRLRQPAYNVVNAQMAWQSPKKLYQVRLWAKNLTDTQYTTALGSQPTGDFAVFAPPRTYGFTLQHDF